MLTFNLSKEIVQFLHLLQPFYSFSVIFQDPFSERRGVFQYDRLLTRLQAIRAKLVAASKAGISSADNQASETSDTDLDEDSSNSCSNTCKDPLDTVTNDFSSSLKGNEASEELSEKPVPSTLENVPPAQPKDEEIQEVDTGCPKPENN